jgi:hypothetical protein
MAGASEHFDGFPVCVYQIGFATRFHSRKKRLQTTSTSIEQRN